MPNSRVCYIFFDQFLSGRSVHTKKYWNRFSVILMAKGTGHRYIRVS